MEYRIIRYHESVRREWDEFVGRSRNGTFLFMRAYMDYHSDRFSDCSWLAYKENRLMALLPANLTPDGTLHSHGGLTYGGWVLPPAHLDGAGLLDIFTESCGVWRSAGIKALDYKTIPHIYCSRPSQEDEYALFRLGARLSECNLSATVDLRTPPAFNQQQRRHLAKALRLPVETAAMTDIDAFMEILTDCLRERHDTAPVHTASEMKRLSESFPDNIRFFATYLGG
ncbi:MAG: GNAT family N-acetyltransferase, partial [Muribaculaceae bacterium]|nr:GNAT family N-acetyltransferase [Muribaculaceae bacterium]